MYKRQVQFDDDAMDLALDVKPGDSTDWCRILPRQAVRVRKMIQEKDSSSGASTYSHHFLSEDDITSLLDEFDTGSEMDDEDGGDVDEEEAAADGVDE